MRRLLCAATVLAAIGLAASATAYADVTEGTLVTREGERLVEVPLKHTRVHIRVVGYLAEVSVVQTFVNPYDRKIEAIYAFPLPTGAAVGEMTLRTGDEVIRGALHRRGEAKRIYEVAMKRGHIAALLEEERPNLFTQSVANIEPGSEIVVEIHYDQELPYDDGTYELVFPMVASPRYVPGGSEEAAAESGSSAKKRSGEGVVPDTERVPDASRVTPHYLPPDTRSSHEIDVSVELETGVPIRNLRSTSHRIVATTPSSSTASITLAPDDTVPNRDFVLRYDVAGDAPEAALLTHRRGAADERGAFFLMVHPPRTLADSEAAPRELVFAIDTSSSMEGAPLEKAKEVIRRSLRSLRPDDTFQIVRFSDRASALGPAPIANKPRNVELALAWLDALTAGGGTEMTGGVRAALDFPHDPARLRMVLLLTDGYIGNEDEVLRAVHSGLGPSRVFAFGVGTAVNRYLLEEMAALGRGTVTVVRPDEDTTRAVDRFLDRISTPVLTDIAIDWQGLPVTDAVPAAVPDLFLGQPLVLHGRYLSAGSAVIEVTGTLAGRRITLPVDVVFPERNERNRSVATVWAKARIRELSRELLRRNDPEIVEAITELSLQHGILGRYTAFVAVSEHVTGGGPAKTVPVPLERPAGMRGHTGRAGVLGVMGYGGGGSGYGYGHGSLSLGGTEMGGGGGEGTIGIGSADSGDGDSYSLEDGPHKASVHMPMAKTGEAVIAGSLSGDLIRRSIRARMSKFKYCYSKALKRRPDLEGKITVAFIVEPTGKVASSAIAHSTLDDADLEVCVLAETDDLVFPAAEGGGIVEVRYPFVFSPAITKDP